MHSAFLVWHFLVNLKCLRSFTVVVISYATVVFIDGEFTPVFSFFLDGAASFQSKASDSPAVGLEFHNITLSWTYSLGGTFISAAFSFVNVTSGLTVGIAQKVAGGSTDISQGFKERFLASIADSEAHLTILSVQRSDKGTYQFQATATNFGFLSDSVDVEVQCKLFL